MKPLRFVIVGGLVVAASVFGWRTIRRSRQQVPTVAGQSAAQPANSPRSVSQASPGAATDKPSNALGPFSIAGRDYFIDLQNKKVRPGAVDEQGDTVVGMEIRDA